MTDSYIAFECERMTLVDWHSEQTPATMALAFVQCTIKAEDGTWVAFFDRRIRSDDAAGILAAARLLGCGQVTPRVGDLWDRRGTITVQFVAGVPTIVSDPQPLADGGADVSRFWNDLQTRRKLREQLREVRL